MWVEFISHTSSKVNFDAVVLVYSGNHHLVAGSFLGNTGGGEKILSTSFFYQPECIKDLTCRFSLFLRN
jgi:hypothetical protein